MNVIVKNSLLEKVEAIAQDKRNLFKDYYLEMIGSYKGEKETNKGYNGRQLLELIQNCDDEGSKVIEIRLNEENNEVSISNTGNPFSEAGYRSLTISNLSSKTSKRQYIGNKGLGFRSIINWSEEINIYSNDISVHYSEEIRRKEFDKLFSPEQQKEIRKTANVKNTVVPMPFSAIPKVTKWNNNSEYTTVIKLKYREGFLDDIIEQVEDLDPELLLFLKNVTKIKFKGFVGVEDLFSHKQPHPDATMENGPVELVMVNDEKWSVFHTEGDLPGLEDEEVGTTEFYELKLAVKEGMSDDHPYMYSHFPTTIRVNFPYIIHGTFDLDQNRNQLNDTEKNRVVLKKLVKFIVKTSRYLSGKEVNWLPFRMLHFNESDKNERLEKLGFYERLSNAVIEERVFPCVDGKYRKWDKVVHLNSGFSQMILDNGWADHFKRMLIPLDSDVSISEYKIDKGDLDYVGKLDAISKTIKVNSLRAKFIHVLYWAFSVEKFDLLIDRDGKLISKNDDIYTPARKDVKIPDFCDVKIIDKELYDCLIVEFDLVSDDKKARALQNKLKTVTKIHSYEPNTLAQKIISKTKDAITQDSQNEVELVVEMTKALYNNYLLHEDNSSFPEELKIPSISRSQKVRDSEQLVFDEPFESGELTHDLFGTVYDNDDYLAPMSSFGLEDEDIDELEEFFNWIGIMKYSNQILFKGASDTDSEIEMYCKFLKEEQNLAYEAIVPEYYAPSKLNKILENISIEKLCLWANHDEFISKELNTDTFHSTTASSKNGVRITVYTSFFKYKVFKRGFRFDRHLLDDKRSWINEKKVNYSNELLKMYDLKPREVDNILVKLGAKDEFNDLDIHRVTKLINSHPERFPDGRNASTLYNLSVKHYEANQDELTDDVRLFANNGNGLQPFPAGEVYFSDTAKIPKRLQNEFPTLHYPNRSGGTTAIEFFGINDLKELEFNIVDHQLNTDLTDRFRGFFDEIKHKIFVYRVNRLDSETQLEKEASILNDLQFYLCNSLEYEVEDVPYGIDNYEYVPTDNSKYFIKVKGSESLTQLRQQNQFASTIAEIITHALDVSGDKNDYYFLIAGSAENANFLLEKFTEDELNEARQWLGDVDYEFTFWRSLFRAYHKDELLEPSHSVIASFLEEQKLAGLTLDFLNLNSKQSLSVLENLFAKLKIPISQFNQYSKTQVDLRSKHQHRMDAYLNAKAEVVKSSIWKYLKGKEISEQSLFLEKFHEYEDSEDYVNHVSQRNQEQFDFIPEEAFRSFVVGRFPWIRLENEPVNLTEIRDEVESNFTADEVLIIEEGLEGRSLLFFENAVEYLKKKLADLDTGFSDSSEYKAVLINNDDRELVELDDADLGNFDSTSDTDFQRKPFVPKSGGDRGNKKRGNDSERAVYDRLVKLYGFQNVNWKSKDDEGLHYDIRYSKDDGESWIYVEVKSYSGFRFQMSFSEFEFGKENANRYEVWLVSDSQFIPIREPFDFGVLEFDPKDYWVTLNK